MIIREGGGVMRVLYAYIHDAYCCQNDKCVDETRHVLSGGGDGREEECFPVV